MYKHLSLQLDVDLNSFDKIETSKMSDPLNSAKEQNPKSLSKEMSLKIKSPSALLMRVNSQESPSSIKQRRIVQNSVNNSLN